MSTTPTATATATTSQEEHTMKKNTQAVLSVKMNDQFQINAAVNYWNSQKSWGEIFRDTGFVYKAEAREWGVKLVVHAKGDEGDTYGIVFLGEPANKMIELSESMMTKLNTSESSVDKEKFFAEQIFFGDYEKMLKKEIIPFYERHLRDLAAEESIEANKAA